MIRRVFFTLVACGLAAVATSVASEQPAQPRLEFAQVHLQGQLGVAYHQALHNLLVINAIPADLARYNRTGLLTGTPPHLIRAGGDYQEPWTRDASVNSWNAANLLHPTLARNTLWSVCERLPDGHLTIQRDNQWWDKLIWVQAAWHHYLSTGDRAFLTAAYEATESSLQEMMNTRFDDEFGLFQGPSHLADGIAGYPEPFDDPQGASSFILDHAGSDRLMTLSVNCITYRALRCAAEMARVLQHEPSVSDTWNREADALQAAIEQHLWLPEQGWYAYFLHGDGALRGQPARYREVTGLALAIHFGVCDATRGRTIVRNAPGTPFGIPLVDPDFSRYCAERPSRHGRIIWPMAQGYWATAASAVGELDLFQQEVEKLVDLVQRSEWNFREIYHPLTGQPDGGWQNQIHWESCSHQTWSATAFLRMVHDGLFGVRLAEDGLSFAPQLPAAWGSVCLKGIRYRNLVLEVQLNGRGSRVVDVILDGAPVEKAWLPCDLAGSHRLEITLAE